MNSVLGDPLMLIVNIFNHFQPANACDKSKSSWSEFATPISPFQWDSCLNFKGFFTFFDGAFGI